MEAWAPISLHGRGGGGGGDGNPGVSVSKFLSLRAEEEENSDPEEEAGSPKDTPRHRILINGHHKPPDFFFGSGRGRKF